VSVLIGLGMPTDHVAENHQLLGIKDGEKVYYMITKKDSADSPNTIFVIKDGDTISEKVLDGKYVIYFDEIRSPEVVFHRTYVQNKNLRIWFFTLKGPTWYEFTVPDPSNIQQSL